MKKIFLLIGIIGILSAGCMNMKNVKAENKFALQKRTG